MDGESLVTVVVPKLAGYFGGWLVARELFVAATGQQPHDWQEEYLRETRDTIILKGRQVGASTGAGVLAIRRARYWPNSLCAIVSPSLKQSTEVKERAKQGLLRLGERLVRDSSNELALANGSRILSLPGSAKSVRGWSAHLLVIDEAAFLDQETFLAARATVAATGGRTIVQSTPEGPFGHFYDLWTATDHDWAKYRVRSDEVTSVDPEFLARERATLTDEEYAQEYEAEFTTPGLGLVDEVTLARLTVTRRDDDESIWPRLRG